MSAEESGSAPVNGGQDATRVRVTLKDEFPCATFDQAAPHLRRPFTPEAIKFKVQTTGRKSVMIVPHIDARLAIERLNLVVPRLWTDHYRQLDAKLVECELIVDGLIRADVGEGSGKAGYSDALKRAAVKFGVGVSLYAIPKVFLAYESAHVESWKNKKGETVWGITDHGDGALRKGYAKWLEEHGEPNFGPALGHGDVDVSVGDPAEAVGDGPAPVPEDHRPLLEGPEVDKLREACRDAYRELGEYVPKATYPPAQFQAELQEAGHSLDELEKLLVRLTERAVSEAAKQGEVYS